MSPMLSLSVNGVRPRSRLLLDSIQIVLLFRLTNCLKSLKSWPRYKVISAQKLTDSKWTFYNPYSELPHLLHSHQLHI